MGEYEVMIQPNHDLLALFGLSVDQASARIGSTRMSIRRGFAEREEGERRPRPVLNLEDVIELRMLEHCWGELNSNEPAIIECLRARYGDKVADQARTAFEWMATPCRLEDYEEIWILLPDFRHLIQREKEAEYLRDLLQFPGKITFYTGGPVDHEKLQQFIGGKAINARKKERPKSLAFKWATPVGSWGSSLLGNPSTEAALYVRGMTRFVRPYPYVGNGNGLVARLRQWEGLSPLQHLLTE